MTRTMHNIRTSTLQTPVAETMVAGLLPPAKTPTQKSQTCSPGPPGNGKSAAPSCSPVRPLNTPWHKQTQHLHCLKSSPLCPSSFLCCTGTNCHCSPVNHVVAGLHMHLPVPCSSAVGWQTRNNFAATAAIAAGVLLHGRAHFKIALTLPM